MNLINQFIHYLQIEKRYSTHTLTAYEEDLNQFSQFAELKTASDWKEVNHQLLRAWIVQLIETKQSNRTVVRKISSLRSFFKWMLVQQHLTLNPMLRIRAPKTDKKIPQFAKQTELQAEKVEPLFANDFDGYRDRLMFEVFYQTGIRLSELLNLKEINVSPQSIKVLGKRNKERIIPIGKELFEIVERYREIKPQTADSIEYLFVTKKGTKLNEKFVYRKINTYLRTVASLQKNSPHVMRHTFATHMLNNGAGMETLKELLGHANLSATQVYTHSSFAQINKIYSQAHPRGHNTDSHES
jgi:integrase/recombinase XerC